MSVLFEHVGVPVSSIEKSKKLYCGLMGFQVFCEITPQLAVYSKIAFLEKNGVRIELMEMKGDGWTPMLQGRIAGMVHFALKTDNLLKEHKKWKDAGYVEKILPNCPNVAIPGEEDWWMCYFFGPDGESIELRGPKGE